MSDCFCVCGVGGGGVGGSSLSDTPLLEQLELLPLLSFPFFHFCLFLILPSPAVFPVTGGLARPPPTCFLSSFPRQQKKHRIVHCVCLFAGGPVLPELKQFEATTGGAAGVG